MSRIKLKDLVYSPILGEWGKEESESPTENGIVNVIRTTNFLSTGKIDYTDITRRAILKKRKENDREFWIVDDKKIEDKRLKNKDLVIEKSGGGPKTPVGRVVIFEADKKEVYLCSNFLSILRPKKEVVIPEYLLYQFKYLYQINKVKKYQNQTTGIYNLKLGRYLDVEVDLPPISEQSLIVAQLNTTQELINKRLRTIDLLDEYIRSVFLEMFGDLGLNIKEWNIGNIDDVKSDKKNSIKAGPFGSKLKKEFYVDKGYKVYGQEQVIKNNFEFGNYYIDEEKYKELESFKIASNDILISLVGTLGKIAIVPETIIPGIINPRLVKITLEESKIIPRYFKSLFETKYIKDYLEYLSRGGTVRSLSLKILKKITFPIPPLDLQKEYEQKYLSVQSQKEKYQQSLELLETMFQAILQNAFSDNATIDEEKLFGQILQDYSIQDIKQGNRIQYLLNWLKKDKEKERFSSTENYTRAVNMLLELLEDGSIEQYLEDKEIKLKAML